MLNTILTHLKDLNYECFWKVLNCSDYGIPQKRLFIVGFHKRIHTDRPHIFEFPPKTQLQCTLYQLRNKNFNQEIARTIRVGGRGSPFNNRHNWDGYTLLQSNSKFAIENRLSIQDGLLLQNFSKNFQLCGCRTSQYKQIGNTIPTNFTFALGEPIIQFLKQKKYFQYRRRIQNLKPQLPKIQHLKESLGNVLYQLLCLQSQTNCFWIYSKIRK